MSLSSSFEEDLSDLSLEEMEFEIVEEEAPVPGAIPAKEKKKSRRRTYSVCESPSIFIRSASNKLVEIRPHNAREIYRSRNRTESVSTKPKAM
ncbi:Oidioi.mRNA.OKI2018_I69.chr1.g1034.t1.cds [Oikopleura dioica]|uniref:Oidioi.mRNA.OKI2018_I69.chr1.g1034.t1.cds n=1 Tax=Oikopleura dioica TaxID=34765 RepID=A0ABN7ST27_OIKDI|nr:Oidioi.mRNA.OKI2018_I69.chr1.g1034.t1.cds [Oikopleura dioica]